MENDLKILVADDHSLVREGLRVTLADLPAISDIIEAASADEVKQALTAHPDVNLVILDLHMPGSSELELLKHLCNTYPAIPIVVLSAIENQRIMQRAIEHGAAGYIPKSSANSVLVSALRLVLSGGVYIPTEMLAGPAGEQTVAAHSAGSNETGPAYRSATRRMFTARQLDVLELLAAGHSNKAIARELGVSEHTIKIHLSTIFRILDVNNRTEAAIACRELGLVEAG